jgi:predicted ATP-dependent endonuclease of OLD family
MQYSTINITNFRSVAELKLENFKQVNLITGRNNCGKTTVLEALFLISGMSNPQLPVMINNFRDLNLNSDDNFNSIFHNLDFEQEPKISALLDGTKRSLTIRPKYAAQYNNTEKINSIADNITANAGIVPPANGLLLEFNDGKTGGNFISEISLSGGGIKAADQYKEILPCFFHYPQLSMSFLPQIIEKLLVNKQMGGVIAALQEIDPKITDIRMGAMGMIYVDIGLGKLLPINIMGDGIRRIFSILTAVPNVQGGILFIDEIENGLHYSTLEILWKSLLKALEVYHVQLFATTHSNECIGALVSSHKMPNGEMDRESDTIRLYRIEKQENKHRAFEYTPDLISAGIDSDIEMR